MAVALGVPETNDISEMSNEKCQEIILDIGSSREIGLNPVSGIPGKFYTANRAEDIRNLVLELLKERIK